MSVQGSSVNFKGIFKDKACLTLEDDYHPQIKCALSIKIWLICIYIYWCLTSTIYFVKFQGGISKYTIYIIQISNNHTRFCEVIKKKKKQVKEYIMQ